MSRLRIRLGIAAAVFCLAASPAFAADPPKKGAKSGRLADAIKKFRDSQNKKEAPKPYAAGKDKNRQNLKTISPSTLGAPLSVEKFNKVLEAEVAALGEGEFGKSIADDQYIRRVFLDVVGQLPSPADVREYVADTDPGKKAKLVDRLLAMPQFGENWARYWHDAISYRNTSGKNREVPFDFEPWMAKQFNANVGWDKTVTAIIAANGPSDETPQGLFLACHDMSPPDLAGESARLFLGLQLSCAQCHDHPNDHWKRDQFHELAAFFGRVAVRRTPQNFTAATIGEKFRGGEYRKPDLNNPSDPGTITPPIFLTGQPAPKGAGDLERRQALAEFFTTTKNPLFAKAFVNRMWAVFVGEPFTGAVDDIGDYLTPALPKTFAALSKSFAASKYDVKKLVRTIVLSDAYDRAVQKSPGDGASESEGDSAGTPIRIASTQIFDALTWALGDLGPARNRLAQGPRAGRFASLANSVEQTFGVDPSTDAAHVEGSIPQALLLMNNPQLNGRLNARNPSTILGKLLNSHKSDKDAIEAFYLRALARRPTEAELGRCMSYLQQVNNRPEAFEDIMWALLNSTEFLYNH